MSRSARRSGRTQHKTLQLCRQVERELPFVFAECSSEVVQELMVASVEPNPSASRLLITVVSELPVRTVLQELNRVQGFIRTEIAMTIHRRKVPELIYRCVHPQKASPGEEANPVG